MQNPKVSLIYSESMSSYSLRAGHVQQPIRVRYAYELMDAYGLIGRDAATLVAPKTASDLELAVYHTEQYIEAVKRFSDNPSSPNPEAFGFHPSGDTPAFENMYKTCCEITGGSIVGATHLSAYLALGEVGIMRCPIKLLGFVCLMILLWLSTNSWRQD